jgi:large subunit ribosomal protein L15
MSILSKLKPKFGSRHRRKRIGLGEGSGHGGSATKGMKGQRSRSGQGKQVGFEGGQTPLLRRIPKRGFNNKRFTYKFQVVNLGYLETSYEAGAAVTPESLREQGLVKGKGPIKVLGDGELKKKLSITADAFSAAAKEAIEKAGGTVTVIERRADWKRAEAQPEAKKK